MFNFYQNFKIFFLSVCICVDFPVCSNCLQNFPFLMNLINLCRSEVETTNVTNSKVDVKNNQVGNNNECDISIIEEGYVTKKKTKPCIV